MYARGLLSMSRVQPSNLMSGGKIPVMLLRYNHQCVAVVPYIVHVSSTAIHDVTEYSSM